MKIKPGGARIGLDALQEYTDYLVDGLVPTDGIQYSAVATFGTTAVEIFNKLIDPGFSMQLRNLYVGLTQKITNLKTNAQASPAYYWQAREEYVEPYGSLGKSYAITGGWVNITGTYAKGVGSLLSSEDTFGGYIPVGSVPHAPVRLRLMAAGLAAAEMTGVVRSNSLVQAIGLVMPTPA